MGLAPGRNCVPWYVAGRKPLDQFLIPPTGSRSSSITTKEGRSRFADPRPYCTHEPSEGRPARMEPVFIWQTEPTWLRPSAQQERRIARSSTCLAISGYQSETQAPL